MKKILSVILTLVIIFSLAACSNAEVSSTAPVSSIPEPEPEPITVTVAATGDMLIHTPIISSYLKSDGSYDFSGIYKYCTDLYSSYDYFITNLEVTFGGTEAGKYCGTGITFNCPDSLCEAMTGAGIDLLLTANNHSYDTGSNGLRRTRDVLKGKGINYTGTYYEDDKKYTVEDIGGIKIGIVNYTYQTGDLTDYSLNGRGLYNGDQAHINMFSVNHLDSFYSDIEAQINSMREDGAEAIMLCIHWGNEYHLEADANQKSIAQKMCDLGVDVIVGGHPHVIEPIDVLTSSVSGKKTVCIYSTGNAVSNQRIAEMQNTGKAFPHVAQGASEDGVVFSASFTKYGDGRVEVTAVDYVATWVNLYVDSTGRHYEIVPLTDDLDYDTMYNLKASGAVEAAKRSKARTDAMLKSGIEKFNSMK